MADEEKVIEYRDDRSGPYTDPEKQENVYYDECNWKTIRYPDPQKQYEDDVDD